MKTKYLLSFIAFVASLMTCFSQSTNFSSIYDSQELFKIRKQVPYSNYGDYAYHFYLVTKAEEGNKNYSYVSKQAIVEGMSKVINNSFDSQYTDGLRKASSKSAFENLLPEAIGLNGLDYLIEAFYGDNDRTPLKYFEVVMPISSSEYGMEYPFELKGGQLVPLKGLEPISEAIEKSLSKRLSRPIYRSMSSKYGATFINGNECILFSYCDNEENCTGYRFNIAAAYDMATANVYYAMDDFGGYKTTVPKGVRWQLLGTYGTPQFLATTPLPPSSPKGNTVKQGVLTLINNSGNAYTVSSVRGDVVVEGGTQTTLYLDYNNLYRITIKQNYGYLVYPTVLYYDVQFDEDHTERTIRFPF
ncbi:hypothetical protein HMPREF1551_01075 [Capnocytophaga sp. oral taxon 863 str. F0517]|uniref:hypothetical protein n=1 Tax=Capnocytophaga sp. oral taxon 863 TaxID=1227265 RepID=UPI000397C6BC|nr:hypothetical protein [Capnocytophaga sp. oral taxon 863]ERI63686.1 hypothetical protein HMPREF1551_01075 [Capnocytophaga sp. oral taxon 863 str. F0517]